ERPDFHVRIRRDNLLDQLDALFHEHERLLLRIGANPDDQMVIKPAAALDDVKVAQVKRIKYARVNRRVLPTPLRRLTGNIRHRFSFRNTLPLLQPDLLISNHRVTEDTEIKYFFFLLG